MINLSTIRNTRTERGIKRRLVAALVSGVFAGGQILPAFATIDNTVTATYSDGTTTYSTSKTENVDVANAVNSIAVDKSGVFNDGGNGRPDVGDVITYTFVVENTGNTTLQDVRITESFSGSGPAPVIVTPVAVTSDSGTAAPAQQAAAGQSGDSTDTGSADQDWDVLGPRDVITFTASYAITQVDIDAGLVTNNATASGVTPSNATVSAADQTTTVLPGASSITLAKSGILNAGTNGRADVGDTISYQLTVTNTGVTTLTNVRVNDPLLASLPQDNFYAALDAIRTGVDLASTASLPEADVPRPTQPASVPDVYAALHATRSLVMISGDAASPKAGDTVGIVFDVTNVGDTPLVNVMAEQADAESFNNRIELLARGASEKTSLLFTHVLSDADIASGSIAASARVKATSRNSDIVFVPTDEMLLAAIQTPEDIATATILPANFGPLAPGQSTTFTAAYTLTQTNINAGVVNNTATASAASPNGTSINSPPAQATVPLAAVPAVAVLKTGSVNLGPDGRASVNDVVTYTFTVSNPGNVSINGVTISDPLPGLSARNYVSGDLAPVTSLDPGENWVFTATYGLTQANINAGFVQNSATVNGTAVSPGNPPVTDVSDPTNPAGNTPTDVPLTPQPAIAIVKPVGVVNMGPNGVADVNDTVAFTFTVTNPGNVSFTNVTVADPLVGLTAPTLVGGDNAPLNSLDPGEAWTYNATYPLTQQDIDAGQVQNTAAVSGRSPGGTLYNDGSHPTSTTQNAPTITPVTRAGRIALIKRSTIADSNSSSVTDIGDTINYTFEVQNLGNVTLSGVTINDPTIGPVSGSLATLAPGAVDLSTFTASHVITAQDVQAGRVTNTATVVSRAPDNSPVQDVSDNSRVDQNDPTVTAIVSQPEIAVLKYVTAITDENFNSVSDPGDKISYAFKVRNTGNVALTQVSLADTIATVSGGSIGVLLPGDTDETNFTATYTLTAADNTRGYVENSATVSGTAPNADVVNDFSDAESYSENDPTRTYLSTTPRIAVVKRMTGIVDANSSGTQDAGDVVTYEFIVANTGNQPLTNVTVVDPTAVITGGPIPLLAIAQSDDTTFTASRIITQADLLANGITNQATASGQPSVGARVSDLSDDSSVLENDPTYTALSGVASVAVVKTIGKPDDKNGNGITDIGDVINYNFAITNTGSVTLRNVTLTDNNAVITGAPIAQLNPGITNSTTFKGKHVVTVADAEAGSVTNQATVRAESLSGEVVTDSSDNALVSDNRPTITPIAKTAPSLSKTAARSELRRGETVSYTISAANLLAGPYTFVDTMPPGFSLVKNSVSLNGSAVAPSVNGSVLTFMGTVPNAEGRVTIKMMLKAGTSLSTGAFVNRVALFDESIGTRVARADATVTIKAEHVFDCGEIIGRVFDDRNGNGYADEGEPGMPGVRVVTVNGLLLTSDKNGRFHVSCADVPDASIGTNFILKLDTASLPHGYHLTTENPRDVRLTRGKVTKLNFGVTKSCDVALDIRRDAFVGNTPQLKPKWEQGLDQLTQVLQQCPGTLKLTYHCGQYAPIADTRLRATETALLAKWVEVGAPYNLAINSSVQCEK